jgi:hypothetical protein
MFWAFVRVCACMAALQINKAEVNNILFINVGKNIGTHFIGLSILGIAVTERGKRFDSRN